MSGLLSGLLSLGRRSAAAPYDYEKAKSQAAAGDAAVRRKLAARANVQPEILYFLANDADAAVRRELDASGAGGHASAVSALDEKVTPRVLPPRVAARAPIATARHGHAYPITRIFRCASAAGSSCAWAEI